MASEVVLKLNASDAAAQRQAADEYHLELAPPRFGLEKGSARHSQ